MSRYIDVDLLLAQCQRNPLFEKTEKDKGMMYIERSIIDATPTADVEEVRHGEWLHETRTIADKIYHRWICSVCGRTVATVKREGIEEFPYCHCGAKMDGERSTKNAT